MADVGQAAECLGAPDDAGGVVRVAEQEHPALGIGVEKAVQAVEVHGVTTILEREEWVVDHLAVVALGREAEGMVDGRLDDDFLVGSEEDVDGHTDALDDAGDVGEPLRANVPVVMLVDPADDGGAIVGRLDGVAEEGVLEAPAEGVGDEVRGLEVHVGHPKGQQVGVAVARLEGFEFECAGATAVDDFVEIVGGHLLRVISYE